MRAMDRTLMGREMSSPHVGATESGILIRHMEVAADGDAERVDACAARMRPRIRLHSPF